MRYKTARRTFIGRRRGVCPGQGLPALSQVRSCEGLEMRQATLPLRPAPVVTTHPQGSVE